MKTSENGLMIIKQFEGVRYAAYRDIVGVWTIGFGSTHGVIPGAVITASQAEAMLRHDIVAYESFVNAVVKRPINQLMFDALVSFTYNVGQGALQKSSTLRLLNMGDYRNAADALLLWNKAGGIVVPALARRRNLERALFLHGYADMQSHTPEVQTPDTPADAPALIEAQNRVNDDPTTIAPATGNRHT